MSAPTLFCLHALGSSRLEFAPLADALGDEIEVVALDLPGFGDASTATGTTVDDMVSAVIRGIRRHGSTRWMILGHSMGGKIASLVAARTLDGTAGLFGLRGVVLLAGSPPTPEPMSDDSRAQSIAMASDGPISAQDARQFVDDNIGARLADAADTQAIADVRRASPEAWRAWFERGSLEDRSHDVGTLDVPAALVAGGSDGDLGPSAQLSLNGRVYPRAEVTVLGGAGHLLPWERPRDVADVILRLWRDHAGLGPVVPDALAHTIGSSRTSSQTRAILARRALADNPFREPLTMTDGQLATLRAVAARVVPQGAPDGESIDLAGRVDSQLARGHSDGWRNVALPPDPEAYRRALDVLADFGTRSVDDQDALLRSIADGDFDPAETLGGDAPMDAAQMTLWFEDCRVDLVRTWLAHPATMARIGYDGFANGGDVKRIQGFQRLGAGEREGWEPELLPVTPVSRGTRSPQDTRDAGHSDTSNDTTEAAR